MDERTLIEGCIANDRRCQEALYRRFFPAMWRMCMRYTSDREEALSIVNDGFLRAFKKMHTFGFRGSLEGWIRRLVFHSLSDHFRRKGNDLHWLKLEERDRPRRSDALSRLYLEDLMQLIEEVPPASREVFRLYAIEGLNHREIAARMGISEGTSKWHLSNARKMLQQFLKEAETVKNAG